MHHENDDSICDMTGIDELVYQPEIGAHPTNYNSQKTLNKYLN